MVKDQITDQTGTDEDEELVAHATLFYAHTRLRAVIGTEDEYITLA